MICDPSPISKYPSPISKYTSQISNNGKLSFCFTKWYTNQYIFYLSVHLTLAMTSTRRPEWEWTNSRCELWYVFLPFLTFQLWIEETEELECPNPKYSSFFVLFINERKNIKVLDLDSCKTLRKFGSHAHGESSGRYGPITSTRRWWVKRNTGLSWMPIMRNYTQPWRFRIFFRQRLGITLSRHSICALFISHEIKIANIKNCKWAPLWHHCNTSAETFCTKFQFLFKDKDIFWFSDCQ